MIRDRNTLEVVLGVKTLKNLIADAYGIDREGAEVKVTLDPPQVSIAGTRKKI